MVTSVDTTEINQTKISSITESSKSIGDKFIRLAVDDENNERDWNDNSNS